MRSNASDVSGRNSAVQCSAVLLNGSCDVIYNYASVHLYFILCGDDKFFKNILNVTTFI